MKKKIIIYLLFSSLVISTANNIKIYCKNQNIKHLEEDFNIEIPRVSGNPILVNESETMWAGFVFNEEDELAYVANYDWGPPGLQIFNVTNWPEKELIRTLSISSQSGLPSYNNDSDLVYLPGMYSEFRIINVSDPYNPFLGMWIALVRQPRRMAGPLHAEQRISREQALRLYTINNAFLSFEEHEKGSIEVGKLADFVVLDRDILTCPTHEIPTTQVRRTYLGGRLVYQSALE